MQIFADVRFLLALYYLLFLLISFILTKISYILVKKYFINKNNLLKIRRSSISLSRYRIFRKYILGISGNLIFIFYTLLLSIPLKHLVAYNSILRLKIDTLTIIAVKLAFIWFIGQICTIVTNSKKFGNIMIMIMIFTSYINMFHLTEPISRYLEQFSISFGNLKISIYSVATFSLTTAILIWLALALLKIASRTMDGMHVENQTRSIAIKLLNLVIIMTVVIIGLNTIGVDSKTIAMIGSAVGVGVGFGLQKITSNFISGIILAFEKVIKEGDVIEISNGITGTIKSLRMRYTLVESSDGREIMLPNELFILSNVTNLTYTHKKIRLEFEFTLEYSTDFSKIHALLLPILNSSKYTPKDENLNAVHFHEFADNGVKIMCLLWIEDIDNARSAKTEVISKILNTFTQNNITIVPNSIKIENTQNNRKLVF